MSKERCSRRAKDARVALTTRLGLSALLAAPALAYAADPAPPQTPSPVYETVVNAPAAFQSRVDEAASTAVVTADRTARSGETVEQLVAELPGVAVTRYGGMGALSTLSVRGSAPSQVQVYVDDIPLNLATGGGVDLGFIPVWGLERLEIFKNVSPLEFGASGVGGIMSVRTQTPRESRISGAAGVGSWGTRNLGLSGAYVHRRASVFAAFSMLGWQGNFPYADDRGTGFDPSDDLRSTRLNNELSQRDGLLRVAVPLEGTRSLTLSASFDHRRQGVPGLAAFPGTQTRLASNRETAQLAYESRGDLGDASRVRANVYVLHMWQSFSDVLGELASAPTLTSDTHWATGGTVRLMKPVGAKLRLRAVLDTRHERFVPKDTFKRVPTGAPGTRTFLAAGAEPSVWFPGARLEVAPSARLEASRDVFTYRDMFSTTPEATAPAFTLLPVLRLSAVQHATEVVSLRANVGRYVRAPSTTERYGNTGYLLPNPLLRPETGLNADVGMRLRVEGRRLTLDSDLALFAAWAEDLIQFQQNAQGQARAANVGAARIQGLEAAAALRFGRHLRTAAQVTLTRAVDASDTAARAGKQLPFRPRARAYLRPELHELSLPFALRCGVYADADFTAGNYRDPANLVSVPQRLLFGAGASLAHDGSGVRLVASAVNLTNAPIFDLAGFPLPGRSLFFTLEWTSPPSRLSTASSQGDIN